MMAPKPVQTTNSAALITPSCSQLVPCPVGLARVLLSPGEVMPP